MLIARQLQLPKKNSFFLFGPRQVGKSTLISESFSKETALTYELLKTDEYVRLKSQPSLFREEILGRKEKITHVVVDEIQKVPELLDEIHYLMEKPKPPCFVLSGSSARKLKRAHANLLAGRAWTLLLHPLTHMELGESFDLKKCLEVGTLPKIYLEEERENANHYLKSYVETYLKEEIEAEALLRQSGPFLRFLFLSGSESGNILNYSNMGRETGCAHTTVKEYYKILEDTLIGFFLLPFHKSNRKRLSQHPKFYFFDTGVQRALSRKLSLLVEPKTEEWGNLFEHWVIAETMRLASYWKKDFSYSYFRTEQGAEVDLIVETPAGKIVAIEIKSSSEPRNFSAGFAALKTLGVKSHNFCVSLAPRPRKAENIEILPWQEYFQMLKNL